MLFFFLFRPGASGMDRNFETHLAAMAVIVAPEKPAHRARLSGRPVWSRRSSSLGSHR